MFELPCWIKMNINCVYYLILLGKPHKFFHLKISFNNNYRLFILSF